MGNGDQFSKLLAERLKFAKEELSEAEKAEKSAHEKVVFLSEKVEAFSRALAAETGSPVLASRDSIAQMETPSQLSRARQLLEKIERGK